MYINFLHLQLILKVKGSFNLKIFDTYIIEPQNNQNKIEVRLGIKNVGFDNLVLCKTPWK